MRRLELPGCVAAAIVAFSVSAARDAQACDAAWQLSGNAVSCVSLTRAGDYTYKVKNACSEPLHVAKRDQAQTGTASLTITPGSIGELSLPFPAKAGDAALYDCTAGNQAGELRFTFAAGDCGGCSVARPGTQASLPFALLVLVSAGGFVMVMRRRARGVSRAGP
ncbi:MAG: hypothetical protein ACOY0T_25170 [Myxococcota bacterium]